MSSTEKFRTIGHSAPITLETTLPKNTFLPIQRVFDTDSAETAGYLFRNIEYNNHDTIGDIILQAQNKYFHRRNAYAGWHNFEQNRTENPQYWFLPPGPLVLELFYRVHAEESALANDIRQDLTRLLSKFPYCGTTVTSDHDELRISHRRGEESTAKAPANQKGVNIDDCDPVTNALMLLLFGKRYSQAQEVFQCYGDSPSIYAPTKNWVETRALVLGITGQFDINIGHGDFIIRPAFKTALASNLLKNPKYEVRDE